MVNLSKRAIRSSMQKILDQCQYTKTKHPRLLKKMKELYESSNEEDFTQLFIEHMKVPLTILENSLPVQNTMIFLANFATTLIPIQNADGDESVDLESLCPFLVKLVDFLIASHQAIDVAVRFRVCHFLNLLLNSMGTNACIDDDLCDKLSDCLTNCLMDRTQKVRAQAAMALQRLQDPANDDCPVIKMYLFHMSKDPSAEVRKIIINNIARNAKALKAVLRRTCDNNDSVRKQAYLFISKILVRSLTIKHREYLLRVGLDDSSESVRNIVKDTLLPTWLEQLKGNYLDFIQALDAEIYSETICKALPILFSRTEKKILFEQIPINLNDKFIPIDEITPESALYWRCYVEFLRNRNCEEDIDECVPELTKLCDYIRDYQQKMMAQVCTDTERMSNKFILLQLFEMTKGYDLGDEVGRANLKQLILDTLMTDNCSEKIIESIVEYAEKVIPDVPERLSNFVHVISEIRMPIRHSYLEVEEVTDEQQQEYHVEIARLRMEIINLESQLYDIIQKKDFIGAQKIQEQIDDIGVKIKLKQSIIHPQIREAAEQCEEKNDPITMVKSLKIVCVMAAARTVTVLSSTLRSLFDNMILPSMNHEDNEVQESALKAGGICLLLDGELAKKYWGIYLRQLVIEDRNLFLISLKIIFDLFLRYGLDYFDITHDDNEESENNTMANESQRNRTGRMLFNNTEQDTTEFSITTESEHNYNIVKIMLALLDHGDEEVRTVVTHGFCKLLLHNKLSSVLLMSRLIILFFNPVTERDISLHMCLRTFFKIFVSINYSNHEILARTFMPILRIIEKAPNESPLQAIDPLEITNFILDLTNSKFHKSNNYSVHNQLAFTILAEVLTPKYDIDQEVLLKSLRSLNISCDSTEMKRDLLKAVSDIDDTVNDRSLKQCLRQFSIKIQKSAPGGSEETVEPMEENDVA